MDEEIERLRARFEKQSLNEALAHLDQAVRALARSDFEAANSQVRSTLESLFDEVAKVRLGTNKRGGAARKELEDRQVLGEREARLVQTFISAAGGSGSHPGSSSADEARGRLLAGLGVCLIGLSLLPDVVKVEEVLAKQLKPPKAGQLPQDGEIRTRCPSCGDVQVLGDCQLRRDGSETVYVCHNGCQAIVVIGPPGDSPWPGRGYRLGDHVIRNISDLVLPIKQGADVLIPASSSALKKQR
jgi:hypothetical protein